MPDATGYQNPVQDPMWNPAGFNKNLGQDPTGFKKSCTPGSYRISNILHSILCKI